MAKTILVVDDHASIRQMVRFALQLQGYQVVEAANGEEALCLLAGQAVDLLVTDWWMPIMDGSELLRRMREHAEWQQLPVVVISCENSPATQRQAREFGILLWMKKPFRMAEIQGAVARGLAAGPLAARRHVPVALADTAEG